MASETNSWRVKRIGQACIPCRSGKVRCEGGQPCPRCRAHGRECVYGETTPAAESTTPSNGGRLEMLMNEVRSLRNQVSQLEGRPHLITHINPNVAPAAPSQVGSSIYKQNEDARRIYDPIRTMDVAREVSVPSDPPQSAISPVSPSQINLTTSPNSATSTDLSRKRKRSRIELSQQIIVDFVVSGTLEIDQARSFFYTFFEGCDRYVPVFDPDHDTFDSVRRRNGFLFNVICTTGSSIKEPLGSRLPHMLNFELKKQLNLIVLAHEAHSIETVQALLVLACYSPERSLILSFAIRMALDLSLNSAFEMLTRKLISRQQPSDSDAAQQGDADLMRQSRTWFGMLVLENILHVDAGKLPTFTSRGGARRCRVLLQQPHSTALDLRLLSQVELNYIRARIHDTLADGGYDAEEDILDDVRDARIDIELWFDDWSSIIRASQKASSERPSLLTNLTVQRHWSDAMAVFWAVKCLGTDNIDAMGQTGSDLLEMARVSLKEHLAITIDESNSYLANLRFSMDFVWAKCAFCFLLLLKLSRLLPESEQNNQRLLEDGNSLLHQLSNAVTGAGSSASRLYLQVLSASLEKYGQVLREHQSQTGDQHNAVFFWESNDAGKDLQSFVPEQFVFEWDFPGLTLFSSPTAWQEFFDDFLLGFNGQAGTTTS